MKGKFIIVLLFLSALISFRSYGSTSLSIEGGLGLLQNDRLTENGIKPLGIHTQIQYGLSTQRMEFGVYYFQSDLSGKIIHDGTTGKLNSKSSSLGAYILLFQKHFHFEFALGKADFKRSTSKEFDDSQETSVLNIYNFKRNQRSVETRLGFGFFLYQGNRTFIYNRYSVSHYKGTDNNEISARIGLKFLFK